VNFNINEQETLNIRADMRRLGITPEELKQYACRSYSASACFNVACAPASAARACSSLSLYGAGFRGLWPKTQQNGLQGNIRGNR
jgi:hypothetical protein